MTPHLRTLATKYRDAVALRDSIPLDTLPGGGASQPIERAEAGIVATRLAHELARAVVEEMGK